MTTYVQMHNWVKLDQPVMICSQCGLRMPAGGAWVKAQYSSCLPNDHQWYWQPDKRRYYCFLCQQDVTYAELDSHTGFNPNSIVGAKCPQEGIKDKQKIKGASTGFATYDEYAKAVEALEAVKKAKKSGTYSMTGNLEALEAVKFPAHHEWLRQPTLRQMVCAGCGLIVTDEGLSHLSGDDALALFKKPGCVRRALPFPVSGDPLDGPPPEPEPPSIASKRQILAWEV